MTLVKGLTVNQAWWAMYNFLPEGTDATRAVERAQVTGADWGERYHLTYDRETGTFDLLHS